MTLKETTHRRGFLGRVAAAAAASLPWAASSASAAQDGGHDDWLKSQTGDHRCFFDFPGHLDGFGLVHIRNYIMTYAGEAYGEDTSRISTLGTFYGAGPAASIPLAFNDTIWSDYELGEYMSLDDKTGSPATRNIFHRPEVGDPIMTLPGIPTIVDAGIENLQKHGTTFLLCNNAIGAWSKMLAHAGKGPAEKIESHLRANILPGVVVVPAMVIAIEKAQAAGISYNRQ